MPGARTPDKQIISNLLEQLWIHRVFSSHRCIRAMPWPSQPLRAELKDWSETLSMNWSLCMGRNQQWTRRWLNSHHWMHKIEHHLLAFWPDCSLWTKIQTKNDPMTKRLRHFQPGWSETDSTEDNPGCSMAKMNHLKIATKTARLIQHLVI